MTHQENYNLSTSTIEGLTRNGLKTAPILPDYETRSHLLVEPRQQPFII